LHLQAPDEYLEQQRAEFSRFYFVGDDDLLEIVGNSKEQGGRSEDVRHRFGSFRRPQSPVEGTRAYDDCC
jgi:dynein heavy chain 1